MSYFKTGYEKIKSIFRLRQQANTLLSGLKFLTATMLANTPSKPKTNMVLTKPILKLSSSTNPEFQKVHFSTQKPHKTASRYHGTHQLMMVVAKLAVTLLKLANLAPTVGVHAQDSAHVHHSLPVV